jgi:hypothetical protein
VLVEVFVLRDEEEYAFGLLSSFFFLKAASLDEAVEDPDAFLSIPAPYCSI